MNRVEPVAESWKIMHYALAVENLPKRNVGCVVMSLHSNLINIV